MSYKGALKVNIPSLSEDVFEFRYIWKIDLVFKEQSGQDGQDADDVIITVMSGEVPKARDGKEYLLSENLFKDYSNADVAWAYYNENMSLSSYYDTWDLCGTAVATYLSETYPELSYSFSNIDVVYFKFRTYDDLSSPLRTWSDWNEVTDKFKRVTLFDNLATYDEEDPFIYSNAFFNVDIEGFESVYMKAKGQNELADTQFNYQGANKLNAICMRLDDASLIANNKCFSMISFYDNSDMYVTYDINEEIKLENIFVEDGGVDITSSVMESDSSYDYGGDYNGCVVLEKLVDYTDLFTRNGIMVFSFNVVCLDKVIMTIPSSITRV